MKINVDVSEQIHGAIVEQSKEIGVSPEFCAKLVLESFFSLEGGKVWRGDWFGGGKGARRIVVQWPYIAGFYRLRGEEVEGLCLNGLATQI